MNYQNAEKGQTALGYANAPTPLICTNEISEGMAHIQELLSRVHEQIGFLEERLHSVISPQEPQKASGAECRAVRRSPLGDALYTHAEQLEGAIARLAYMRDRIQL